MRIKILLFFVFVFSSNLIIAQESKIIVTANRLNFDSLEIKIENISTNDTILFSLYKQISVGKKWITNVYDVFSEITNPKTSVLIINPKESLNFRIHFDTMLYTDEKLNTNKHKITKSMNRILFQGNKMGFIDVKCVTHSNVFK